MLKKSLKKLEEKVFSIEDNSTDTDKLSKAQKTELEKQKDLFLSSKIVFNENNLEKISHKIFPHSRALGLHKKRTIKLKNGYIIITPQAGEKALTHRQYMTLLSAIHMWFKYPVADDKVTGHLSDIVRIKGLSTKSGKNKNNIYEDLMCLSGTTIDWIDSFAKDGKPGTLRRMHLIQDLIYDRRMIIDGESYIPDGSTFDRKFSFKINSHVMNQIRGREVNPVAFDSLLEIRSEIAAVYFSLIDTKLSKYPVGKPLEWGSLQFFKEMELLAVKRYEMKSQRAVIVKQIATQINGKMLSNGLILSTTVLETKDKKDFKIRHKLTYPTFDIKTKKYIKKADHGKSKIEELTARIGEIVGQEETHGKWYTKLATYYSENVISRSLSDLKQAVNHSNTPIQNKGAFFTTTVHRVAHDLGYDWIGQDDCGKSCPFRPENSISFNKH